MKRMLVFAVVAVLCMSGVSEAAPTKVVVRAKAKDAKFIGTSMTGALVIIRDAESGEVIAKGLTEGSTGNTNRIMIEPVKRGSQLSDEGTAKFEATIEIDRPRLVTVEVHAPYSQRQSMTLTTTQVWLLPGRHIVGDGVVVEVPGFVVDVTAPQSPDGIKLSDGKASVQVKATITTMCGCLVTPGGIWDADRYQVAAMVKRNGKAVGESPLKYAGKASSFEGVVELAQEGLYDLEVYAFDPATGNSGLDRTTFTVY